MVKSSTINDLDAAVAGAFALLPTEDNLTRGTTNFAVDTGTVNTYLVALPHVPSGYVDGLRVTFRALNTNTGASTINVNSLGVKSIRRTDSTACTAGDITVGGTMEMFYSTATGFFHLAPNSNASAVEAATQVGLAAAQVALATTQATNAAASYDSFDDRYLGAKTADPTLDNDGNALLTGALYYNSVISEMRVYSGSAWLAGYLPASAYAVLSANTFTEAQEWATGASIASASTINLDTATGNRVHVTGTTTITAVTLTRGPRTVIFDGILTLTHHATNNNLNAGGANITTEAGGRCVYESDGTTVYGTYIKASGLATVAATDLGVVRSTRTSNTILGVADQSTLIDITSGTFSQTFAAAATLGSGWWCRIRNSGTGDITLDPNGSETIDGLTTFTMYPGEVRLIQCDGTDLISIVLSPFARTFTTSGTFTKPPGYRSFGGLIWGSGGGGSRSASVGSGGGGGGCLIISVLSSLLGATETVTIGAGGLGKTSTAGVGGAGNNSTFAGFVSYGASAQPLTTTGGGGGGANSTVAAASAGGHGFEGGVATLSGLPPSMVYGGASGGGNHRGGDSIYGGAGGGAGTANPGVTDLGGSSLIGGDGGAGSQTGTASNGTAPGGGGGGGSLDNDGGDGARGELQIWGLV